MGWLITHKRSYDTDFISLPKDLQSRATQAHVELANDPVTVRGETIRPMLGFDNVWRYRIGDHRLIYAVASSGHVVQLLAIGPRGRVYKRFDYKGWDAPDANLTFGPQLTEELSPHKQDLPEWMNHPDWFRKEKDKRYLPRRLTPAWLKQLLVPFEYHPELSHCRTEDDLEEARVPYEVFSRIIDSLWPPSAEELAHQPDQVLFNPQDLEAYAEGTLRGFLLHLDDYQRRITDWALSGPTLVKGGPGSGKSTVALYRVRAVLEHAIATNSQLPEILFTTYTNALIRFSNSLLHQLLGDTLPQLAPGKTLPEAVRITTVDKLIMWIAKSSGKSFGIADPYSCHDAIRYARSVLKPKELGDLDKMLVSASLQKIRDDYLLEEFEWVIEGQNCRAESDYLQANRTGRAIPFNKQLRGAVWQVYAVFCAYMEQQSLLTWGQLRQLALDEVRSGHFKRRWDYVIVDEAQDLTPVAISLCVELCHDPAGLFLTADANQSLYNRSFRWRKVHNQLNIVGRTRILRRNYRTTKQIAFAAAELMTKDSRSEQSGGDVEALKQEYIHSGNRPVVYTAENVADQARWLAHQLYSAARDLRLPINAAAVLVPSNSLGESFAKRINEQGLPARFMPSRDVNLSERCIKVMTLHAAKGLEFPIVALAHIEEDRLPKPIDSIDEQEIGEHLEHQRRIFFVGCTRAMRHLFITGDRWLPSPFLEDLSDDHWIRLP